MEYNRIVAVTGLPGLYEIVSSKNDGALVRSVEDKTTRFVSSRVHNLSHLESIEIYTTGENVNLAEVFEAMKAGGAALPDVKDAKALKGYFEKIYPALDFERVYNSDMKKMVKWYEALNANGITFRVPQAPAEAATDGTEVVGEASAVAQPDNGAGVAEVPAEEAKPRKAAPKKKAAPKASADAPTDGTEAAAEEKPKKKAAPKKKKEDPAE